MFNHHMPWGYNFLFTGYGESKERVNLDVLDVVDQQLLKTSENKGSLYPNLSNVWWKIIFLLSTTVILRSFHIDESIYNLGPILCQSQKPFK